MYKLLWKTKAVRQLEKIRDRQAKMEIVDKVDGLKNFPACQNIKPLKNHKYDYRLRVGKFRVMFSIGETIEVIEIEEVKKCDERTY